MSPTILTNIHTFTPIPVSGNVIKISISRKKHFDVACAFAVHVHQAFIYPGDHGVLDAEIVEPAFNPEDDTAFVLVDYAQPLDSLIGETFIRFE